MTPEKHRVYSMPSPGNGLNETMGYSARGIPQSYSATPYAFSLGLAANGMITSGNDSVNGNWTYGYDPFNRLVTSNKSSGAQTFSYVYDRYGNRLQQNAPQGGPAPQYLFDNNNRITGSGVTYDALGNIQTDGLGNTFTYDAESRLIKVVNSGGTYNYTYNAEGQRIKNGSSEFLYDLAGRAVTLFNATSGVWNYGEIYAGGRHLATYSGSTTNFLHSDWLGTKRVMSNMSGANSQTCTSLPFGDGQSCTGTEWGFNHFTDDIHDSESNLEHTWFRQLSGTQGRWTRPDPYLGSMDFGDPQSLNRFDYVANDPVNFLDPTGLNHTVLNIVGDCLILQTFGSTNAADEKAGRETLLSSSVIFCGGGSNGSGAGGGDGGGTPGQQCSNGVFSPGAHCTGPGPIDPAVAKEIEEIMAFDAKLKACQAKATLAGQNFAKQVMLGSLVTQAVGALAGKTGQGASGRVVGGLVVVPTTLPGVIGVTAGAGVDAHGMSTLIQQSNAVMASSFDACMFQ